MQRKYGLVPINGNRSMMEIHKDLQDKIDPFMPFEPSPSPLLSNGSNALCHASPILPWSLEVACEEQLLVLAGEGEGRGSSYARNGSIEFSHKGTSLSS